jgi:hypothetical protein
MIMSNKRELNAFNKLIWHNSKKFCKNFFYNVRPTGLKNLYYSKYEKWIYVGSMPLVGTYFLTKTNMTLLSDLILMPVTYFIFKSFGQTNIQNFYLVKYRHVSNLFNKNVAVVSVKKNKLTKDIVYTIHSYVTIEEVLKKKLPMEQYFNTNIINIRQHKIDKRIIYITTNKVNSLENSNSIVDKLLNILRYYNFLPQLVEIIDNDFYISVEVEMLADIKHVLGKIDDIGFKLKKHVDVELENNYIFKIKKNDIPVFNFEDYLYQVKLNTKNKLQYILGLRHKDGKIITADTSKTLHTFINGLTGSGKSCIFNSIIQSLMYWNSKNICFLMVDFKYVEFKQYQNFVNVNYITNIEDFIKVLDRIIEIMNQRFIKLDTIKNIEDYNHKRIRKMPYIIICIDECSFISTHKKSTDIWKKLTDIVQRGRACGVIVQSATQCPDHRQVNTSFRRQVDTKICGRLRTQSDLEIVGIDTKQDIKKFNIGEFIIDGIGFDNEKLQGLFIDEKLNKNKVFEDLQKVLDKKHNSIITDQHNITLDKNIKLPSSEVIKLNTEFGNLINNLKIECKIQTENKKNITKNDYLYMLVVSFLHDNCTDGGFVPTLGEIEDFIERNIGEKLSVNRYRTIKEDLYKINVLWKITEKSTKYKINFKNLKKEYDKINNKE